MRIKNLIFGAVALLAVATGCRKAEIFERSVVSVSVPADVTFPLNEEKQTIELKVDANCSWVVKEDANWLVVRPMSGTGKGVVTVYVAPNDGVKREAVVNFFKDDSRKVCAPITISQTGTQVGPEKGDGTFEHPYLASQASEVAAALANGATTETEVYVQGYVKKFGSKHEDGMASYGNATFYLSDDETYAGTDFQCYQVYYAKGVKFTSLDQIKVGDLVVVCSKLTNYNGTPETVGKGEGYCVSINGTSTGDNPTPGPEPGPITGDNLLTNGGFETWEDVPDAWMAITTNATVTKGSDAHAGSNAAVIAGDASANKRMMSKAYVLKAGTYELKAFTKGEGQFRLGYAILQDDDTIADTKNDYKYITDPAVAGADWTEASVQFTLAAQTRISIIIMNSNKGAGKEISVDDVSLATNNGGLADGSEGGEGDDPTPGPDPVPGTGDGTVNNPYTAAQAAEEALKLASGATSEKEVYVRGYIVSLGAKIAEDIAGYGNCQFTINDVKPVASSYKMMANPGDFLCFQVMYLGNVKFTSADQIKVGDEVVVCGKLKNYSGTAETDGKGTAYIYALNGKLADGSDYNPVGPTPTPDPEPEPTPGAGNGTLDSPYSASEAAGEALKLASGATSASEVYIHGFIKSLGDKIAEDVASYGNCQFTIADAADGAGTTFLCFQVLFLEKTKFTSADQIKVGDEVIVYGKLKNYNGTIAETDGKGTAYIYSLNGQTKADDAGGDPEPGPDPIGGIANTMETAYTTSEAIALYDAGNDLTTAVYVKGKFVKTTTTDANIANYKNMDIYVTDGTNEFEFFRCKNLNNTDFTSNPFKEGDELIAYGVLDKYNSTYELKQGCYIVKHTAGEGGDPTPDPEPEPTPGPDPVTGDNILSNASFESWTGNKPDGWHNLAASNASITKVTDAYDGTAAVSIATSSSNKRFHADALDLKAGTYTFTVHTKGEGTFKLGYGPIKEDGTVDTSKMTYMNDTPVAAGSSWTETSVEFTLESDSKISVCVMNSKNSNTFLLDAVSLTSNNGGLVGDEPEKEFTLDDIDVLEAAYYSEGPVWDFSLYASEGANYGIYVGGAKAGAKNQIAGSYTLVADADYYGFMTEAGDWDPMTNGTVSISCVSAETEENYGVYSATVNLTFASGSTISRTFSSLITVAYDADTYNPEDGSVDDIVLVDTPSPVVSSKAVKSVKKSVKKHTVKKSFKSVRR